MIGRLRIEKKKKRKGKKAFLGRKRAKIFARQFKKQLLKQLGTTSMVFNDTLTGTISSANDTQLWSAAHLCAANGTATALEVGEKDLNTIQANNTAGDTMDEKYYLQSGFLDLTYHNTSTTAKAEVDVYWIAYNKQTQVTNLLTTFTSAEGATGLLPAPGVSQFSALSPSTRGVTPFQFPAALAYGLKVLKKVKHFVPAGGYFSTQWKDTRPTTINPQNLANSGMAYRNKTISCLFITKKITGSGSVDLTYSIGATRTYTIKWLENNKDYDGQLVGGG